MSNKLLEIDPGDLKAVIDMNQYTRMQGDKIQAGEVHCSLSPKGDSSDFSKWGWLNLEIVCYMHGTT